MFPQHIYRLLYPVCLWILIFVIIVEASNEYIITLRDGVSPEDFDRHTRWVAEIHSSEALRTRRPIPIGLRRSFNFSGFIGYSGEFDNRTLARIEASGLVASIHSDLTMTPYGCIKQQRAPWGLARLSSWAKLPPDLNNLAYNYKHGHFNCCSSAGGPWVYVLDTGIMLCHRDFEGRASNGYKVNKHWANGDTCGHGTAIASIVAGKNLGVMKTAKVIGVKVMGGSAANPETCTGKVSEAIAGIEWALKDATQKKRLGCSVINISGGVENEVSEVFNDVVNRTVAAGVPVIVAAGNGSKDACKTSPSSAKYAISVGATDENDAKASYSNYGSCVDIFAPGSNIEAAGIDSCSALVLAVGTSYSAPHVSGLAAFYQSSLCVKRSLDMLKTLQDQGTWGVVVGTMGSKNLLASSKRACPQPK